MAKTNSVSGMLGRAAAIGTEIERVLGDISLQRLSRPAWIAKCLELGGFATVADLEAARAKLTSCRYLNLETQQRAQIWRDHGLDRPGVWAGYEDGRGEMAAPYAERLMAQITVEQASAIASYIVHEIAPDSLFGRLNDHSEVAALIEPLAVELAQLDKLLAAELRVADVEWSGGRGTVRVGPVAIVLDEGSAGRLASAVAETVRDRLRSGLALAA